MVADAPSHTSFQILHSGSVLEAKTPSLVLSAPSPGPNQLWSLFPSAEGPWIINRGTGAYLEAENGVALVKIETPYEWNIQKDGTSIRLESVSQKQLLQASPQGIKLSTNRDADTLFTIPIVANPILSIGSEDDRHSPEHTCVTNHVYNTVNALNGVVKILDQPAANASDIMAKRYTPDQYKLFKARGKEATQNLDFAREVVASWFTVIGSKMTSDVNEKGKLENTSKNELPVQQSAQARLDELSKTHVKTEAALKSQQEKFDKADKTSTDATTQYQTSLKKQKEAQKYYDDTISSGGLFGADSGGGAAIRASEKLDDANAQRKGDEAKMNSAKTEREQEEKLLTPLNTQSTKETSEITKLQAEIANAKSTIDGNTTKATQLQTHHDTLKRLHGLLTECRTHLADTLQYNLAGGASLTTVRKTLKNLVEVLQVGDDFKEPLQILDRAALDHLMTAIPAITSHASPK